MSNIGFLLFKHQCVNRRHQETTLKVDAEDCHESFVVEATFGGGIGTQVQWCKRRELVPLVNRLCRSGRLSSIVIKPYKEKSNRDKKNAAKECRAKRRRSQARPRMHVPGAGG